MGFDPRDRRGLMQFVGAGGAVRRIELASWPQRASRWVHPPAEPKGKPKRKVKWADEKEAADKKSEVSAGKQLIALLKQRGQRV